MSFEVWVCLSKLTCKDLWQCRSLRELTLTFSIHQDSKDSWSSSQLHWYYAGTMWKCLHFSYMALNQHFGYDVTSVSCADQLIMRAWNPANTYSQEIRRSINTEQVLIVCGITTKVLVKCCIYELATLFLWSSCSHYAGTMWKGWHCS